MPFLGREMGADPTTSDEIAKEIDDEIRRVIEEAHDTATRVLRDHMDGLHRLSAILIERETIDKEQSGCWPASPRSRCSPSRSSPPRSPAPRPRSRC